MPDDDSSRNKARDRIMMRQTLSPMFHWNLVATQHAVCAADPWLAEVQDSVLVRHTALACLEFDPALLVGVVGHPGPCLGAYADIVGKLCNSNSRG